MLWTQRFAPAHLSSSTFGPTLEPLGSDESRKTKPAWALAGFYSANFPMQTQAQGGEGVAVSTARVAAFVAAGIDHFDAPLTIFGC